MISYKYIFVVLVYKNTEDIQTFISSLEKTMTDYRIIVVNSYSDEKTASILKSISHERDCDFLQCENQGYGFGNNIGIKYAKEHYDFKYLIVSNPDIEILRFPQKLPEETETSVIGPYIQNLHHKPQNPYLIHDYRIRNSIMNRGFEKNSRFILNIGQLISRIDKVLFLIGRMLFPKSVSPVFAVHGSFIIFPSSVINKLYPVFDERIFLFSEELDLAQRSKSEKIPICFVPVIRILHKEDGSMKYESNSKLAEIERDSFVYVYNKWVK